MDKKNVSVFFYTFVINFERKNMINLSLQQLYSIDFKLLELQINIHLISIFWFF